MQLRSTTASLPLRGRRTPPHNVNRQHVRPARPHYDNRRPSTAVAYQQDESQQQQQQDLWESSGSKDVRSDEHWSNLLTTMPGLSCRHWSGRLGKFILSSASTADVVSSGSVLHLWKATGSSATDSMSRQQDAAAQGGNVHEGESYGTDEVAVRYFTAEGFDVTAPSESSSVGLSAGSSKVVWDQRALKAKPTAFTFSPKSPQLSLTLPAAAAAAAPSDGQQQQQQQKQGPPPLYRTMRLLPLSSRGVCVLNAALPGEWGEVLQQANPPGSYWFFEVMLEHPDASGEWQASTLGVAYDWKEGRLHSHKYLWQKATAPLKSPKDDLNPVVLQPVTPPTRDSKLGLQDLVHKLAHAPVDHVQRTVTTYTYNASSSSSSSSSSGGQHLQRSDSFHHVPAGAVAMAMQGLDTVVGPIGPVESYKSSCGSVHGWFTGKAGGSSSSSSSSAAAAAGGGGGEKSEGGVGECDPRQQVLWFPEGGCWARVPAQLPSVQEGDSAAADDAVIEFEIGAVYGDGDGMARCVLQFGASGDRRIKSVVNEEWKRPDLKSQTLAQ